MASPPLISKAEHRWLPGAALIVLGLASLPYIFGALAAGPDRVFIGLQVNPLDGLSYLAKMRLGLNGDWQFHLLFTPEQGAGVFLLTYFIALGQVARLLSLPLIVVFHAARLLGGLALLWVLYELIARVIDEVALRRRAWWIVVLSSGVGWLAALFGHGDSSDLAIAESNVFFSLIANAHFALAMALMVGVFLIVLGLRSFSIGRVAAVSALSLALAVIQPFAPVTVYAVLGVTLLAMGWRDRRWPRTPLLATFCAGLITAPLMVYLYNATQADTLLQAWTRQNQTPSPAPIEYLLGYGLLWIFAFFGGRSAWKRRTNWDVLLLVWLGVTVVLLYAPFPLQRRFALGLHIPIGVLAASGLSQIVRAKWPRRAVIALTLLTSVFLELALLGGALAHDPHIYVTQSEAAALNWLQANAPAQAVVLAAPEMGAFVPALAGQRVIYGHPFETVEAERREREVLGFFTGTRDRAQLLHDYDVAYLIIGPRERALGQIAPATLPLDEVFVAGDVKVYRVTSNE